MIKHTFLTVSLLAAGRLFIGGYVPDTNVQSAPDALADSTQRWLAAYGAYIFKREICVDCHTLDYLETGAPKSLDGLGGKYPDVWHYLHFTDPEALVPESTMPIYAYLAEQQIDSLKFMQVLATQLKQWQEPNKAQAWTAAMSAAYLIENQLKETGLAPAIHGSEMMALIAYLQQIPASAEHVEANKNMPPLASPDWNDKVFAPGSPYLKIAAGRSKKHIRAGQITFQRNCTPCHGREGGGGVGPNLTDPFWLHGSKPEQILNTVANGYPDKGMIAWRAVLSPKAVAEVVAFVRSIQGTNPKFAKSPQGVRE